MGPISVASVRFHLGHSLDGRMIPSSWKTKMRPTDNIRHPAVALWGGETKKKTFFVFTKCAYRWACFLRTSRVMKACTRVERRCDGQKARGQPFVFVFQRGKRRISCQLELWRKTRENIPFPTSDPPPSPLLPPSSPPLFCPLWPSGASATWNIARNTKKKMEGKRGKRQKESEAQNKMIPSSPTGSRRQEEDHNYNKNNPFLVVFSEAY